MRKTAIKMTNTWVSIKIIYFSKVQNFVRFLKQNVLANMVFNIHRENTYDNFAIKHSLGLSNWIYIIIAYILLSM